MAYKQGQNVTVKEGVRIGENVVIEDDVYLDYNAIIRDNVHIKRGTYVGANCILGEYLADYFRTRTQVEHPLVIGQESVIRSGSIIYGDCRIGDYFQTGHRATIREATIIGNHVSIGTNADIQGKCEIGDYVRIHSNVFVAQETKIKEYAWIFPSVVLTNDPTPPSDIMQGSTIEPYAVVAAGSTVLPGTVVETDSVVAAGSVVTKDVHTGDVVAGNPAKRLGDIRDVRNHITGEKVYPWRETFGKTTPKTILMIFASGLYDVVTVFGNELCAGFEQEGYEIEKVMTRRELDRLLSEPCLKPYDFIFCLNGGVFQEMSSLITPKTIAVAFFVDHPIYHDRRIRFQNCQNYLAVWVDRYWTQFADEYYPQIDKNVMIAHGGSIGDFSNTRFEERVYDIVQLGGYQDPKELMAEICEYRGENKEVSQEVIKKFLTSETLSFEEAFRKTTEGYGLHLSDEEVFSVVKEFQPEDRFIRAYVRDMAVRKLLDSGFEVHVFGNGWENYKGEHLELLHIHGAVGYKEALDIMGNAKIVLNAAPAHNYGSHERIFDAMLNGAVCFTNRSLYLEENGLEQEVVEYSIVEMDTLPEMIRMILNNPGQAEAITAHAKKTALEHHTWKNRAKEVIRAVEDYRGGKGLDER